MSLAQIRKICPRWGVFDNATEIVIEIRHGVGGDDSKGFVEVLYNAYSRYAIKNDIKQELLCSENGHIILKLYGPDVGKYFKFESGNHVVQRYPDNGKGKRHTSVIAVSVMPLPPDNLIISLPMAELEITAQTGKQNAGGQNVNKVASAIRARHIPTGLSVFINGRDQHRNKANAIKILTMKVNEQRIEKDKKQYLDLKKSTAGNSCRGDKIRTYNFIDSRAVDHRFNKKTSNIESVMKGNFNLLLPDNNHT